MSEYKPVNIDEISDVGVRVPDGAYIIRLDDTKAMMSKAADPNPMVIAEFEVLTGDWEGFTIPKFYVLNVTRKGGKTFAGGLMELKKDLNTANKPLPKGYTFTPKADGKLDAEDAARLLKRSLAGVNLKGTLRSEVSNKDGKTYGRLDITGVVGGGVEDTGDFDGVSFDTSDEWEEVPA